MFHLCRSRNLCLHKVMIRFHPLCAYSIERTESVHTSSSFLFCRSFSESFHSLCPEKPWVTKLSSAGLVYLHFGRQVLAQLTQMKEDDKQLEVLYDKVRGQCFIYNTRASMSLEADHLSVLKYFYFVWHIRSKHSEFPHGVWRQREQSFV